VPPRLKLAARAVLSADAGLLVLLIAGHLTFGGVYLLFCLMQLICLNLGLTNFGNIKMLFMILKPKFMEPEVGVVMRY